MTDRAEELLAREGYDPIYGARPLKRTIQRRLLDALATRVLQGEFKSGDTILVDASDGHLTFNAEHGNQQVVTSPSGHHEE